MIRFEGERVRLLMTNGEYVARHGGGNLLVNEIRVKSIYHDEISAQGKAGLNPRWQFFSIEPFCLRCYTQAKRIRKESII